MKFIFLILCLLSFSLTKVFSQGRVGIKKVREVTVIYPDSTVRADIRTSTKPINVNDRLNYHWFYADKINYNLGGYSGNLLTGNYKVFDLKKKLITQGRFHKGVKNGEWKKWNPKNGSCVTEHWKNGFKQGRSIVYSSEGKILSMTGYKGGLRNGKSYYLKNDSIIKIWFKDDKEIAPKPCILKKIFCRNAKKGTVKKDTIHVESKVQKESFFKRMKAKFKKKEATEKTVKDGKIEDKKVVMKREDKKEINKSKSDQEKKESFWLGLKKKFSKNKQDETRKKTTDQGKKESLWQKLKNKFMKRRKKMRQISHSLVRYIQQGLCFLQKNQAAKLNGGALLYAVFLVFIISLISGFLMLTAFHHNRYIDDAIIRKRIITDVNSAINMAIATPSIVSGKQKVTVDLFDDKISLVDLEKRSWGFYEILKASARWNNYSFFKTALTGDDVFSGEKIALYVADKNNYLSLCGNTIIKGVCYLPQLGPKRAYIEGQSFTGAELIQGEIKKSLAQLPPLNEELVKTVGDYLAGTPNTTDSLKYFAEYLKRDTIINSFENKTLLIQSTENISIQHKIIRGNVIIRSSKVVDISSSAHLDDIVIYASGIRIQSGFTGVIQAFASDSLIIEKECKLNYPSCVGLIDKKRDNKKSFLLIDEKAQISGAVVLFKENKSETSRSMLKIEKDVQIIGQVYCNDWAEHKGKIIGSLYCEKFILSTASSVYENHLLNAIVDFPALSKYYTGVGLLKDAKKKELIKWLD